MHKIIIVDSTAVFDILQVSESLFYMCEALKLIKIHHANNVSDFYLKVTQLLFRNNLAMI